MGNLTALSAKSLSRPGRHGDGDGLYLYISRAGAKSWVQRIVVDGRRRDIGLGSYPDVSLSNARSIAHDNRTAVAEGRDPVLEKRVAREASRRSATSIPTFAEASSHVIELHRPTWSNAKHADQWRNTLATYANPVIGSKPVDGIDSGDVLAVLTPIWTAKSETASRVRQRMETVFDWAIAQGWRLDNPAGRSILKVLPKLPKVKNHHRPCPTRRCQRPWSRSGSPPAQPVTKLSFEFLVLTAARVQRGPVGGVVRDRLAVQDLDRSGVADESAEGAPGATGRWRSGSSVRGTGPGWGGQRAGVSWPLREAAVQHGLRHAAPASRNTRGPPRVPQQLQGLVHRMPQTRHGWWERPRWPTTWEIRRKQLTPGATFLRGAVG